MLHSAIIVVGDRPSPVVKVGAIRKEERLNEIILGHRSARQPFGLDHDVIQRGDDTFRTRLQFNMFRTTVCSYSQTHLRSRYR